MTKLTYYKMKDEGKCVQCGKNRGKKGTTIYCRLCADKESKRARKRRKSNKALGLCIYCGRSAAVDRDYCIPCKRDYTIRDAKRRSKNMGVPFDLKVEDVEWNTVCPIFGIPLDGSTKSNIPSLDRFIPKKGYVKGNVFVLSMKANRLKNNMTIEEVRKLLSWMEKQS